MVSKPEKQKLYDARVRIGTLGPKVVRIVFSVVVAIAVSVFIALAADNSRPTVPELFHEKPLWSVNLHTLGFARDREPTFFFFGTRATVSRLAREAVSFSSAGAIAVAFNTMTEGSNGKFIPGTFNSYLLTFDAATGKSIGNQSVGVSSVRATRQGNFLVDDGNFQLSLYSPELKKLHEMDLRSLADGYSSASFPFNGDHIFIRSESDDRSGRYAVRTLDADTLEQSSLRTIDGEAYTNGGDQAWAASSNYLARWQELKEVYRRTLSIRSEGAEWKEIYKDPGCGPPFYRYSAYFLTDTTLAIQSCNRLTVTDVEGRMSFADTFPPNSPLETTLGASSDGKRFAVSLGQWKGVENKFLDLGRYDVPSRLVIYDTQARAAIASFAISWPYSFALSPDGRQLALVRGGILELLLLPNPNEAVNANQ